MALFYVISITGPVTSSDANVGKAPIASTKVLAGPAAQNAAGRKTARLVEIEAATATAAKAAYQVAYGAAPITLIAGETSNVT